MTIRTIAIIKEYYAAFQGYWLLNELSGFHLIPLRIPRLDTIFKHPPALIGPPLGSTFTSKIAPVISTVELDSIEANTSEATLCEPEDDLDSVVDNSLCSIGVNLPLRLDPRQGNRGLGISGLLAKDGNGPFTGLGVISVRPFPWRHTPASADLQSAAEEGTMLFITINTAVPTGLGYTTDNTLRTEELDAFTEPKIRPGSLSTPRLAEELPSARPLEIPADISPPHCPTYTRPIKNFAAPTISSELKQITRSSPAIALHPGNRGHRFCGSRTTTLPGFLPLRRGKTRRSSPRLLLTAKSAAYTRASARSIGGIDSLRPSRCSTPSSVMKTTPRWR